GLGNDALLRVPHDSRFRMKTSVLKECLNEARLKGITPVCVVANSCSTATGSYDNLVEIADFCEENNLWMHVDGAHGMGVIFSEKLREKVKGIERADSVVIDFHKMLLVPALNTLVMFRNGDKSYETFAQKASYLFSKAEQNVWYNSAVRTIECTKSSLGVIAYTALKYYGNDYFRQYLESRYDLASRFAELLKEDGRFELPVEPESNIVCFRFVTPGADEPRNNQINKIIRERIVNEGKFYIVKAEIEGRVYLRVTIINPVTSDSDLEYLISLIAAAGGSV
ncbi:MAG: aminotransferase class I/II-fold pyridoxal phosphate-dependent enzyme, partial [Bacteroidales bacterium]|nr:aminotransferase class I/II-fold pyridoxal phosphate-dependent enzyme [Bacteroidales bacterium]